jgi:hypothetical protein
MNISGRVVNTDHAGGTIDILEELPDLTYTFKRSDKGTASWSVPLSHPNLHYAESTANGPTGFAPKLTDFRIGVSSDGGVNWETVFGGFCGPVGLKTNRSTIAVAGVDWLEWLNQPYRFTGYYDGMKSESSVVHFNVNDPQSQIITELVDNLCGPEITSCDITTDYLPNAGAWATNIVVHIVIIGDNKNVLDHIKGLAAYNDPWGFEFWMTHDKVLTMYAPRRVTYNAATVTESFKPSLDNLIDIDWTNNGPIGSSTVGESYSMRIYDTYAPSQEVYRDWWYMHAFNNINLAIELDQFDVATYAVAAQKRNPQKDLKIIIKPDDMMTDNDPLFWFRNQLGKVIDVKSEDMFMPYHRIDGKFWIDTQTLSNDNVGNWTCELTLEQIYPTNATP